MKSKFSGKDILPVLKQTYKEWSEDKAPRLGAALAYYTVFSIAPLLLLLIRLITWVYGGDGQDKLFNQLKSVAGDAVAKSVHGMVVQSHQHPASGVLATIIGIVVLLMGASGVFGQLQDALNTIWEVAPKPGMSILEMIKERAMSYVVVLGTGFLLLVSLVLSAALQAIGKLASQVLPLPVWTMEVFNGLLSLAVITLLFAMIFRVLPDAEIAWSDVWIGAAITALLFTLGKFGLGFYLGHSSMASAYGAAGSLMVLLFWVYYAAQILFFGAEFTQVYANKFGSHVRPSPHAIAVTEVARAHEGVLHKDHLEAAANNAPNGSSSNGNSLNGNASSGSTNGSKNGAEKASGSNGANGVIVSEKSSTRKNQEQISQREKQPNEEKQRQEEEKRREEEAKQNVKREYERQKEIALTAGSVSSTAGSEQAPDRDGSARDGHRKAILAGAVVGVVTSLRRLLR